MKPIYNVLVVCLLCPLLGCGLTPIRAETPPPTPTASPHRLTVVVALSAVPLGVTGHTGVAVDDRYWDFGPDRVSSKQRLQGLGSPAGPWWDDPEQAWRKDRSLDEVLEALPGLVHPEGSVVLVFSADISAREARAVTDYWERAYADMAAGMSRYELTHRQCASIGCHSLGGVAGLPGFLNLTPDPTDLPPQLRVMSPTALAVYLRLNLRHTAGPDIGRTAGIERYQLRGGELVPVNGPLDTLRGLIRTHATKPTPSRRGSNHATPSSRCNPPAPSDTISPRCKNTHALSARCSSSCSSPSRRPAAAPRRPR